MESVAKAIEGVHPGNYDMVWRNVQEIKEMHEGNTLSLIFTAFLFGFVKGQRAEKARAKKAAKHK